MSLDGSINGSSIHLDGAGRCSQTTGQVRGDYDLTGGLLGKNPIPEFSHHAFSALVITGYPSESVSVDGVPNPFAMVDHQYERTVSVDGRGSLSLEVDIGFSHEGKNIESSFHVEGELLLPELTAIDTVVETWVPLSDRTIEGTFVMPWIAKDGSRIAGLARTIYYLKDRPDRSLERTAHRVISIKSIGSDRAFHRDQISHLFGDIKGAIAS